MSGEQYEIAIHHEINADLIQKLIESLTNAMNRHGLNKISGKALWTGNLLINSKDKVKTLVSLNTQNARIRLVFPDQSIPKHECERIVRTLGLEIFRGLSACGIKTQRVVQRTGEINVIGIPCG